jgi:hypothetical protein
MAITKINADAMDLTDAYAFTGTVTGTNAGLVKLSSVSASNYGSMNFTSSVLTDTYMSYVLFLENIRPATDNVDLHMYFSINNGNSFVGNINSGATYARFDASGSGAQNFAAGPAEIATDIGNDGNIGASARVDLINLRYTQNKFFPFHTVGFHSASAQYAWIGGIYIPDASAIDYLRVVYSSGNITSGKAILYGVEK